MRVEDPAHGNADPGLSFRIGPSTLWPVCLTSFLLVVTAGAIVVGIHEAPVLIENQTAAANALRHAVVATENTSSQIVTRSVTGQGPGHGRSQMIFDGQEASSWALDFSEPGLSFNGLLQVVVGGTLYQSALYYGTFPPMTSRTKTRRADAILKGRFFKVPHNYGDGDSDIRAYAFALLPNPTGGTAVSRNGDLYSVAYPNQPAFMRLVVVSGRVTSMRLTAPNGNGGHLIVTETFSHFGSTPNVSVPSPGTVTILSTRTRTCVPQVSFVCVS